MLSVAEVLRVRRMLVTMVLMTMLSVSAFPAGADDAIPDDAVTNGGFEIAGHAVRPTVCEVFGDGDVRIFDPDNEFGLPWLVSLNPCHSSTMKAAGWSTNPTSFETGDYDDDDDVEGMFWGPRDDVYGNHNLWQAYPNAHQAYVANFTTLEFTLVSGAIPTSASIKLSLSMTPVADPHPYAVLFFDCDLTFGSTLISDSVGADGRVSIDPTLGVLRSRSGGDEVSAGCGGLQAAWTNGDSEDRRDILDGLRLVQHSYWSFNTGSEPVVIDDISMVDSRTVAEAILG